MKVDFWFQEKTLLVRVILIIIPFIGWIVELLVRISALLRCQSKKNIVGLVIFAIFGGFWVLCLLDVLSLIFTDYLLLIE